MKITINNCKLSLIYYFTIIILNTTYQVNLSVIEFDEQNFDKYISSYELVFVNFHAEWCPFSQQLSPIFKVSDNILSQEFSVESKRVLLGRVDCDANPNLSNRYQIMKYPTLKFFLNGKLMKKEYRGQRTQTSIVKHMKQLLTDPVVHIEYNNYSDLSAIMFNKSAVIGYYSEPPNRHPKYNIFRKVASDLRGFCEFFWVTNSTFLTSNKTEIIAFKSSKSTQQSEYDFIYETYDEFSSWSTYLCTPIVREITFENAEEIIEEKLPLVILFHISSDYKSSEIFKEVVHKELISATTKVNFVTADAKLFDHPLHHINKTKKDLPLIAIDSFKHIYLFPKFEDLNKTGILANFIEDLNSGKLHHDYHFGTEEQTTKSNSIQINDIKEKDEEVDKTQTEEYEESEDDFTEEELLKPVADSVFKKLAPSESRYTILKDEL